MNSHITEDEMKGDRHPSKRVAQMPNIVLEGSFVRLERLKEEHLEDLEKDFDPTLFDFYPKPYSSAKEFVEENFEMAKQSTFIPFAIVHKSTGEAIGCTELSSIDN